MDNQKFLVTFFNKIYEDEVNTLILNDKDYIVPQNKVVAYIREAISIPYQEYLNYIAALKPAQFGSNDITQCSNFESCEIDMCKGMLWANNPGMKFIEIGNLFPNNVKVKNKIALTKYGENQVKTSTQLGLTYKRHSYWYLSCLGYVYPDLDEDERKALLARTILRAPFYQCMMVDLMLHDTCPADYMNQLSISTQKRRESGVAKILHICLDACKKECVPIHQLRLKYSS